MFICIRYGTRIASVREVAATGRLCLMGIDAQGIKALRSNRKIDGLFVYVAPPSLEELERRARGRLHEADSTIQKRLAWAEVRVSVAWKVLNPHCYHGLSWCSLIPSDGNSLILPHHSSPRFLWFQMDASRGNGHDYFAYFTHFRLRLPPWPQNPVSITTSSPTLRELTLTWRALRESTIS